MKYYVVADVHGYYTALKKALEQQGFFDDVTPHKLVICGDLFDRGSEACALQDFIVELINKGEVIIIRGNHEDLAIEFVRNIRKWMTPAVMGTHHWNNGTVDTVLQLTGMELTNAYQNPDKCAALMDTTPFFSHIIPNMVDYFETDNYIFVHGWIPCNAIGYGGKPITFEYMKDWRTADAVDWNLARWYNGMDAANKGVIEKGKTIVCGHWHCSYGHSKILGKGSEFDADADFSPYHNKGIIAIDACTAKTLKVNCIVIED